MVAHQTRRALIPRLGVASCCAVALASCGSGSSPTAKAPVGTLTPTTRSGITIPAHWHRTTDRATGISFALPTSSSVEPTTQNNNGTSQVVYTAQLTKKFGVSVAIAQAGPYNLQDYAEAVSSALRQAGSSDAKTIILKRSKVDSDPSIDFRISFTPQDGKSGKSAWFVRAVNDKRALVVVQTIAFPSVGSEQSVTKLARQVETRAAHSMRLG